MRVMITGISCVGKSTLGRLLAERLDLPFIDFDWEVEKRLNSRITFIKRRFRHLCDPEDGYRDLVKPIFKNILNTHKGSLVLAMPPSGLYKNFYDILKNQHPDVIKVVLKDRSIHILQRLVFYDDYSKPIPNPITDDTIDYYYRTIVHDQAYYDSRYRKADLTVRLEGRNIEDSFTLLYTQLLAHIQTKTAS